MLKQKHLGHADIALLEYRLELHAAKWLDLIAPRLHDRAAVGARSPLPSDFSAWRPAGL